MKKFKQGLSESVYYDIWDGFGNEVFEQYVIDRLLYSKVTRVLGGSAPALTQVVMDDVQIGITNEI